MNNRTQCTVFLFCIVLLFCLQITELVRCHAKITYEGRLSVNQTRLFIGERSNKEGK